MRPANATLQAYLASTESLEGVYADGYTVELVGGTDDAYYRLYWTTAQRDLTLTPYGEASLKTFRGDQVIIKGMRMRASIGLDADEQEVILTPYDDDVTVQGVPLLKAVKEGLFDGAIIRRDRYFFRRWGEAPVGGEGVPLVRALIETFDEVGRTQATLKAKSAPIILDVQMPKNLTQPACVFTLYDNGCGVSKAAHAVDGTVEAGATTTFIPWAAGATPDYALGTIFFENMGLVGTRRSIKSADSSGLTLAYPLKTAPPTGEAFKAYVGCNRTKVRCDALGGRFRGYDLVPRAETAV